MADGRCQEMSAVDVLKATQHGTVPVRCECADWSVLYTHWRHLSNTTEPSVCGSDAAFCQLTLTTC